MNELFIIKDYDTREPFEYLLTDNAIGCKETLKDFEKRRFEEEEDLEWSTFYEMLEERHIHFKQFHDIETYDY